MDKLKLKLEEARHHGKDYDREQEKILLKLPKNFNTQLDDMLSKMQADYADVMAAQEKYTIDRFNKVALNLEKIDSELQNVRCENLDIVDKLSSGLMSAFTMNADDLVELLVEDLLEEQVDYLNQMENLHRENQYLIEINLKKNRLKQKLAENDNMHAWRIIEQLEEYKSDMCE